MQKTKGEGGIISDTFFGLVNSQISFLDKESGQNKQIVTEEPFEEIMMNVIGIKDMYEAWENMY